VTGGEGSGRAGRGYVRGLYHYPVKGLSSQPLERVTLGAGQGFPFDRMFGLARFDSGFTARDPKPLPKTRFYMLARDTRLATLRTRLDPDTGRFTIHVEDELVHDSTLSDAAGAAAAVDFFCRLFDLDERHRPVLAHAHPHRFTDGSVGSPQMMNAISLINLESVRDLGRRIGAEVDPLRFRANLYFDGWRPFSELEHVGQDVRVGPVRARILKRTQRCAATEVNPLTAERDIPVPRLLKEHYGHVDMGVYAEVLSGGALAVGDEVAS
jgi:uncharacterized protein YcbX